MESATPQKTGNGKRYRLLIILTLIFLTAGGSWAYYWYTVGRYYESTDNAYTAGNIIQITPLIAGRIQSVDVNNTDFVKAGTVLVRLDRTDTELALQQAEAQLAQTVRQVKKLYVTDSFMDAVVAQRRIGLSKARKDLKRRQKLAGTGAISSEEIEHARDAVMSAQKALAAARKQMETSRSLTEKTDPDKHPEIEAAAARVRELYLNLKRTEIKAPVSGYVGMRNAQAGQWVQPGKPLMALVPLNDVWVDANFKETELTDMRIGQPVELTCDMLGSDVVYHGRVAGFSAATGSVFSLIPAQNATGNWIKVIQRLAVRIAISPKELKEHPLQIGLSMKVKVDIKDTSGRRLSDGRAVTPDSEVKAASAEWEKQADEVIQSIIDQNNSSKEQR